MKIAYFITGLALGGAETITINIANKFQERGHNVIIVYLTGDIAEEHKINSSIKLFALHIDKTIISFIKALIKSKIILKDFKPDVIHGNMFHANLLIRLLRLFIPIKRIISTEHSNNIEGNLRMKLYQLTDFLSDINTNVSKNATKYFIENKAFSNKKSLSVYNGINLERFKFIEAKRTYIRNKLALSEDDFLFLNVGRLHPAKDQITLLRAFKIVNDSYPKTKLFIIGDGELNTFLENEKEKLGLANKAFIIGSRTNVEDFYCASDCFVLSSAWEGFGLVLVEAMACQLTVIATDSGGSIEVLNNTNFVVPIKNPKLLSLKMEEVYNYSPDERLQIGLDNKEQSQKFDINKIIDIWQDIYLDNIS